MPPKRPHDGDHRQRDFHSTGGHNRDRDGTYRGDYHGGRRNDYSGRTGHDRHGGQPFKKHKDNHHGDGRGDGKNIAPQPPPVKAPSPLPDLPPINTDAPFRHSSLHASSRSLAANDTSYEKLEFLGDAFLELWASKLIYERLAHLPAGRMSQVRELLVKNETLAVYARAYDFDKKIHAADLALMASKAEDQKGNKGLNKVYGDVFEAYVAAVCLSNVDNAESVAQKWVTALWEPAMVLAISSDATLDQTRKFDPQAKETLQKRIKYGNAIVLDYVKDGESVELKGHELGQTRHFIALYLTGFSYEKKLLGKGQGKSKTEAGQWAAMDAMHGSGKAIVEECEAKANDFRAKRNAENDAKAAAEEKKSYLEEKKEKIRE